MRRQARGGACRARVLALATAGAMLAGAGGAGAQLRTPDGRVELHPEAGPSDSGGGEARVRGNLGARGFDNAVSLGPEGARVTNLPMTRGVLIGPGGGVEYEELYGPRVANATVGTGGITAGFDIAGRLTGLNWPGPGHYDHVNFLNITRDYPNQGAAENAGAFGGLPGEKGGWLTPAFGWRVVGQGYASADTETLVTRLANEELGLGVRITDVVHPTRSLLARSFRFSRPPAEGFAHYANMNPTTGRVPRVPSVTDALLDDFSDFATVYDSGDSAILHFRPYRADPASASRIATRPEAAVAREAVAGTFGPGVYLAFAGQDEADDFQAGQETGGLLRGEANGTPLADPYDDLTEDGTLSGSRAAAGKTAGALLWGAPDRSYTVYLSAGEGSEEALRTIRWARERGFARIRARADRWWGRWIGRARLPATDDARTLAVAKHALMVIRTAQDRETGAIVANATTQTPYRQDWIRDGAFFNYALVLAGHPEMVLAHNDFYRRIYRPGGTWDSFYYADGAEAGAVFPYEVDSQAFAIWGLWLPYELGAAGTDYLRSVYPAIRDTANALVPCEDPGGSGLQCYAPEDDAVVPTRGAQGAATVYLAFRSAVAAARAVGERPDPAWERRAAEIRSGALRELCTAKGCQGGRGGVYLAWPSRLLAGTDVLQPHLEQFIDQLDARAELTEPLPGDYFQYPMEPILALAPLWEDQDRRARLDRWNRWLTHEVAEPGVLHYGERIFHEGEGRYLHTIGFPHIWSGAEMYLAAAFTYGLTGCDPGQRRLGEARCRPAPGETRR